MLSVSVLFTFCLYLHVVRFRWQAFVKELLIWLTTCLPYWILNARLSVTFLLLYTIYSFLINSTCVLKGNSYLL